MLFICSTYPYLRVFDPGSEEFIQFQGGKLELDEGDPGFDAVFAEAQRNPAIQVLTSAIQCPHCGEAFAGKTAKANLATHIKAVHFEKWVEGKQAEDAEAINREIIKRSPYACDQCPRLQEFQTADDLAFHVQQVHERVDIDDNGNVQGEGSGTENAGAEEPAPAPAAKASKR